MAHLSNIGPRQSAGTNDNPMGQVRSQSSTVASVAG
jgi:hypothetical protein